MTMAFGNFYGMGYQPNFYAPGGAVPDTLNQFKGQYQQNAQQSGSGLLWVQGEAGAKSFLVAPGQNVLLMDSESSRFYLKSADASGMPMPLRVFEYQEITAGTQKQEVQTSDTKRYVTWDEFNERLAQLVNAGNITKEEKENV